MSDYSTQREVLDSIIPTPKIESVILESSESRTVLKLSYSVSDVIHDDAISGWFASREYERYFSVRVDLYYTTSTGNGTVIIPPGSVEPRSVRYQLPDGTFANKFIYSRTINIPTVDLVGLSVVLNSGFDVESLEADYDIDLFTEEEERSARKIVSAQLIRDSKVSYPLQDFRTTSAPKRMYTPDRQEIIGEYNQAYQSAKIKLESNIKEKGRFISDLWLSRNAMNHANLFFIFDPMSYYENQSEYRHLFKNFSEDRKNALVATMQVDSVRVMRKRVLINETGLGKLVVDYKDTDEPNEVFIVQTSKKKGETTFRTNRSLHGAIRQIDLSLDGVATVQEGSIFDSLFGRFDGHKLYFLTASDYEVSRLSDGKYCYGIEVQIQDGIRDMLLRDVRKMYQSLSILRSILTRISNEENYDSVYGVYKKPYRDIISSNAPFLEHINLYEDMLSLMSLDISESDKIVNFLNIFRQIPIRLSPGSEPVSVEITPESVSTLIQVIETLAITIVTELGESESFLQKVTTDSSIVPTDLEPRYASPHPTPSFKFAKYYMSLEKVHDANVPKRTGLDYLSNFGDMNEERILREISSLANQDLSHIGLSVIDGARFEGRMVNEIMRAYGSTNMSVFYPGDSPESQSPISLTSLGSEFLTPSYAVVPDEIFPLNNNAENSVAESFTDLVVLRETVPSTTESIRETDFFAKLNAVYNEQAEFTPIIYDDLGRESFSQDSFNRVEDDNSDFNDIIYHENFANTEYKQDFQKFVFSKIKNIMKTPFLGTEKTLLTSDFPEQTYSVIPDRDTWSTLPNILRTLSSSPVQQIRGRAFVNSNFMVKINYLQGFKNTVIPGSSVYKSVLKPSWASLTLDEYRANAGKNLLCRISPYEREDLGVRVANTGLPIYDAYFIIKPVDNPTVESMNLPFPELLDNSEVIEQLEVVRDTMVTSLLTQKNEAEGALVIALLVAKVALQELNYQRKLLRAHVRVLRQGFSTRERYKVENVMGLVKIIGYTDVYKLALSESGLPDVEIERLEQLAIANSESLIMDWYNDDAGRETRQIADPDLPAISSTPDIFSAQQVRTEVHRRRMDLRNRLNEVERALNELKRINYELREFGAVE